MFECGFELVLFGWFECVVVFKFVGVDFGIGVFCLL